MVRIVETTYQKFERRLRMLPLYASLRAARVLASVIPGSGNWRPTRPGPWQPGISVLIPERGTPDLLARTLEAAIEATQCVAEPTQIVVLVNGEPRASYETLMSRWPQVEWEFHAESLGFNGAIEAGLRLVKHDWVYLLNSDMELTDDAIVRLMPYRESMVFGLTSQIFFTDPSRRREETGWSDFRISGDSLEVFEREPDPDPIARGNFYAGGGSSLLRTQVLRRFVIGSRRYSPFYYEDTEWGVRAWSEGLECWFVPSSKALHHHRGTVRRYWSQQDVDRIFRRNELQFRLSHTSLSDRVAVAQLSVEPVETRRELTTLRSMFQIARYRYAAHRSNRRGSDFGLVRDQYRPLPRHSAAKRPRVLLVTPFAAFPPAHGGARRVTEIGKNLADHVDVLLLSDEASLYGREAQEYFQSYRSVHLIQGRPDRSSEGALSLAARVEQHAYPRLRAELRRLIAIHEPDVVQLEHMELAALVDERQGREKWVIALHDVYLDGGASDAWQNSLLARFDAVIACSEEDAALLKHPHVHVIPNAGIDRLDEYSASPDGPHLLFMGPFRYGPNREGILEFLRTCWPAVRAACPDATLTILGGAESAGAECTDAAFAQAGIRLISEFVDPAQHLAAATLTLNPQVAIRGSALKVAESLLSGRCCVSTIEGARGFTNRGLEGLVLAKGVAEMADAVIALAKDSQRRRAIEYPERAAIEPFTWRGSAALQVALYRQLTEHA